MKKDGGPAFPKQPIYSMSLRQWYAGMALPEVLRLMSELGKSKKKTFSKEDVARNCFLYADAMIAEGEKE